MKSSGNDTDRMLSGEINQRYTVMSERIRILATSDVHGTIFPYSYADGMKKPHGFARLNAVISLLRDENTLLLDNGDTLQGSALSFYHYLKKPTEISPVTTVMREMKYDYLNVGNHDFNYGTEALMMHLQNVGAPCITANWLFHGKPFGPNYVIREVAGKRIALFAIVTQYIPHWEKKDTIRYCRFTDAYETAEKTVSLLKKLEKPDYIICLYHGGFERDLAYGYLTEEDTGENEAYRILKNISGIDLLITGHQHRSLNGKMGDTHYIQTAGDGSEIACIDIYPDTDVIEPRIFKCDMDADMELLKYVQEEENECKAWLDQPLGSTSMDLKIEDDMEALLKKTQLATFLNKVQLEATGADLSACTIAPASGGFGHDITMRDLVNVYRFPNTLVVKKITGKVLREYLEKNAEFWTIRNESIDIMNRTDAPLTHYNYDMVDGIEYTLKIANPAGERVTDLTYKGAPVEDDQEFTIALTNFRGAGGGGFSMLRSCPPVSADYPNIADLTAKYIIDHKGISFEPVENIHIYR